MSFKLFIYTLSGVVIYRLRADTGVCPYESHLSLKYPDVGVTHCGYPMD